MSEKMNVERMKEFKIMKTLRYLLMVVAMVSVLGVYAQGLAKQPEAKMQSTSTMVGTGTALPFAASEGTYVTGSTLGTYSPAGGRSVHIRKGLGDGDDDVTVPDDNVDPDATPIGDGLWPLLALASVYALLRVNRRKRV